MYVYVDAFFFNSNLSIYYSPSLKIRLACYFNSSPPSIKHSHQGWHSFFLRKKLGVCVCVCVCVCVLEREGGRA